MTDSSNVTGPDKQKTAVVPAPDRPVVPSAPFDALRSTTRLLVGLALIGGDELLKRVEMLENNINTTPPDPAEMAEQIRTSPTGQYIPDDVRHALIGAAFDVQDQIRIGVPRLLSMSDEVLTGVTRPVENFLNRLPIVGALNKSIGQQVDGLQRRGEKRLQRWITIGQREEARSRVLADQTFTQIVDDVIDYLAEKPEVQDLIMGQTTGLAGEVLGEVRERTVSGDSFLEGIVRAVLRKAPRAELPPPSTEIRQTAVKVPGRPMVVRAQAAAQEQAAAKEQAAAAKGDQS
jgi:hypothetical protein